MAWPLAAGGIRGRILVAAVTGPMHRQSATNVDRIVKGAKPGDLPVQARPGSKTAINLKTASINLIVPRGLLVAADEAIER